MKTQLKRLSKSTLAVILSVCLLVSCMTVGIIATDAAKTADERVGANATPIYLLLSGTHSTVKINIHKGSNASDPWFTDAMTDTTKTYNGSKIYTATVNDEWGGLGKFEFNVDGTYKDVFGDGDSWHSDRSVWNGRMYDWANETWMDYVEDVPETKYNVTVNAGSNGSVEVNDAAHTSGNTISVGTITTAKVEAVPNTGYSFSSWTVSGDVTNSGSAISTGNTTNPLTAVGATAEGTLTANFIEKAIQTVTITAPTNGSVTVTGSSVSGNSSVTASSGDASDTTFTAYVDDVLTITTTPDAGCR